MGGFTGSFLAGLASSLATQVFNAMGRRLKKFMLGTERKLALKRCFKSATVAFVTAASTNIKEDVDLLSNIFTGFFDDPEVGGEVVSLLRGRVLHKREMLYLFKQAGYDPKTLPMLDFEKALSAFEVAFLIQAAEEESLQEEIQAKAALEQLRVQQDIKDAVLEMLQVIKESSEQTIQILNGILTAVSQRENRRLEFRFPQGEGFVLRDWEGHYLRTIINHFDKIDLSQVDFSTSTDDDLQAPVRVTEVFTSLYLDKLFRKPKKSIREIIQKSESETDARMTEEEKERQPITALEAIAAMPRLVILGQPGGGKSTLVNHLTSVLARKRLGQKVRTELLTGWNESENYLPVVIILRRFAAKIPGDIKQGHAGLVWDYLEYELKKMGCKEAATQLKYHLTEQGGIVFFDGLDEVSETDEEKKRTIITEAIAAFSGTPDTGPLDKCKVVVTCREYAYKRDDEWHLPEHTFPKVELALFKPQQIKYFINTWYQVVGPKKGWEKDKCLDEASELIRAVDSLSHLQELAQYPLLLTLMAQVHGKDGYLPKDRADLYEKAVNLLLARWENRIVVEMDGSRRVEPALVMRLDVRTEVLQNALELTAFTAHERQEKQPSRDERAADIPKEELRDELVKSLGSLDKAELVIEYIQNRAGILQARDNKVYTFPHRTFQEYLTATYIMRQSDFEAVLRDRVRRDINWWREVFLLACGTQKKTPRNISDIVDCLIVNEPSSGKIQENKAEQVQLSAQALVETEFHKVVDEEKREEPGRYTSTYQRMQKWLAKSLISDKTLPPKVRARSGVFLSQLGDPRKEITTLDQMPFCLVPAGPFILGSEKYDDERPSEVKEFLNYDYWMSRYPVTNAQFNLFVQADGYKKADYWVEARDHKVWRKGKVKGSFDEQPRDKPEDFGQPFNLDNHPVVGITWYEALAFARWVTDMYRQKNWISDKLDVKLPSEAEWEKAATGGHEIPDGSIVCSIHDIGKSRKVKRKANDKGKRDYPWDGEANPNLANFDKTGIGATNAVGCFPGGCSPYGCEEMSGNVWEWTRSLYRDYPYDPRDGREDLTADQDKARVLRGGSFSYNAYYLRCSYRLRFNPDLRGVNVGFRVVLAPLL